MSSLVYFVIEEVVAKKRIEREREREITFDKSKTSDGNGANHAIKLSAQTI